MKVDLLIVGERFDPNGNDRTSTVARAIEFVIGADFSKEIEEGRADLAPSQIYETVKAGCFVILVDKYVNAEATPKIHAALEAKPKHWCYVLPILECEGVEAQTKSIEEAAVSWMEYVTEHYQEACK